MKSLNKDKLRSKINSNELSETILQFQHVMQKLENFAQRFENTAGVETRWIIHSCETGRFLLDTNSIVDKTILQEDTWEPDQIETLNRLVRQNYQKNYDLMFFDIGAYLGWYSIAILKSGLFSEIHAFEANPENFAQLNANILLNDALKAIHVHNEVVSDSEGEAPIRLPIRKSNRGWAEANLDDGFAADFWVDKVQLDSKFADTKNRFLVVKIDVEGYEEAVLRGMKNLFKNNMSIVQVEIYETNKASIFSFFESAGFKFLQSIKEDYFFINSW